MSSLIVTREEIRDHFLTLKSSLRLTPQELADMLGIARQTVYQYGFRAENKGSRVIPAFSIDIMREAVLEKHFAQLERFYPVFVDKERALWSVGDVQTTCRARAIYLAGTTGDDAIPHPENRDPELSGAEELAIRWLRATRDASVEHQLNVSGLGEYDIGRVGRLGLNWGIIPQTEWIVKMGETEDV